MAAEAENELNGPGNAYRYINPIRQRAHEPQAEWGLSGLDQAASAKSYAMNANGSWPGKPIEDMI
jgi:hypothetical protein